MNTLIFYSKFSGNSSITRKLEFVVKNLKKSFRKVDTCFTSNLNEFAQAISDNSEKYDSYIICGGDGTLNFAVNEVMKLEKKPILGYLNFGTLGDAGKNFGITKNLKKSLKILCEKNISAVDLGKIEDKYFVYMASCGAFSTIASKRRRKISSFSYYFDSFLELFKKEQNAYTITNGTEKSSYKTPFILILGGKYVGGFLINKKSKINDGKIEFFASKSTFLHGLLSFFVHKKSLDSYSFESIKVYTNLSTWCLDGELFSFKNPIISVKKSCILFFTKKLS